MRRVYDTGVVGMHVTGWLVEWLTDWLTDWSSRCMVKDWNAVQYMTTAYCSRDTWGKHIIRDEPTLSFTWVGQRRDKSIKRNDTSVLYVLYLFTAQYVCTVFTVYVLYILYLYVAEQPLNVSNPSVWRQRRRSLRKEAVRIKVKTFRQTTWFTDWRWVIVLFDQVLWQWLYCR